MKSYLFFVAAAFTVLTSLKASDTVVAHDKDYYKYRQNSVEIIYTEENLPFARHTASVESPLTKDYRNLYNWKLDETLYVGLMSDCNQIANGFSTQWPNNRQINYIGGTELIDMFSSTSWLDTLLYHETAHNYQVNVKGSAVSRTLHSVFGNGMFYLPIPYIIVPNIMENSFMLEGNAVLNESWHGNGGRLYSGRYKAQTILQAKAGNIKSSDVYNAKLGFPYGDIVYIQGGFYNLYMAEKYGMKNLNSYFRYFSESFAWPQFTNLSMREATGINFENSLSDFAKLYADMSKSFVSASGEQIASSQFFYSLSNSKDEIFFITNESGVSKPELVVLNKKSLDVSKSRDSYLSGKVLKVDGEYYTQGSHNISPTRIYQGLFDKDAFIKEGSESKMVQGYLSSGDAVYFDVPSSFMQAQLYVGEQFYAQVNSSVQIDENDNIYYFKQNKKTRTLYKNKTPLYSYEGFYGIVSDVDSKGAVYFVANSELGSTLYKYENEKVTRANNADNIVEARLVNDKEVLLGAVSEKDYYYVKDELKSIEEEPYETKLFFEDKEFYGEYEETENAQQKYANIDLSDPYSAPLDMHYSSSDLFLQKSSYGTRGSLSVNFEDPLTQNALSIFTTKNESNETIAGMNYSNSQYLLQYNILGYKVLNGNGNKRENGLIAALNLPLYQAGYYSASISSSFYQDPSLKEREPLSFKVDLLRSEAYGISLYNNYLNNFTVYSSLIDSDKIYGAKYSYKHDLAKEFYVGMDAKYSEMDKENKKHGVKITDIQFEQDMDPTTINIPSLKGYAFVKSAGYVEMSLAKVLNFSSYWFTFPASLQRESIYTKYRYYEINSSYNFREITAGLTLSTVMLNKFVVPISFEYIYNDARFTDEKNQIRIFTGIRF